MSSGYSFITSLALIQTNLYRFGGIILINLGISSCLLSLIVFTKKNLRKNPCSIYLTGVNICNILQICTSILFTSLANGYNINPSSYNLIFCRFRYYVTLVFDVLSPCYLILASVDRILLTSANALTRQRSTSYLAYICIILITLFWLLFHIHALILTNLIQLAPGYFLCYFQPGLHLILMGYYSVIIKGILIPLLMIISGLWAVKNVRNVTRVTPVSMVPTFGTMTIRNIRVGHSKDRQLLQILLIDISVYIIFNLMISIILMYQQFNQNPSKTAVELQIQSLLLGVAAFSSYIPFCIGCYTNLLASKTFRKEIKNILMCK